MGSRASALAAEQRGLVTRGQLAGLEWSDTSIHRRLADGLLQPVWPGVYAYGQRVMDQDTSLLAAAFACGEGSVLTARASAAARGLMTAWSSVDVLTPTKRGVELPGICAHRVAARDVERDVCRDLPVASLARTALDLAAFEGYERVGELLDRALLEGVYDHGEMTEMLHARRGCRGMAILRRAVAELGDAGVVFRSRPERRARNLLQETELPQPRVNAWFPTRAGHGHELDLWWSTLLLDVEVDGPHHRMPRQRRKDRLRDADLASFGVTVLRIDADVVTERPAEFVATVRQAVECP